MEGYWNFFVMFVLMPLSTFVKGVKMVLLGSLWRELLNDSDPGSEGESEQGRRRLDEDDDSEQRRRRAFSFVDEDHGSGGRSPRLSRDGEVGGFGHFELTEVQQLKAAKTHGKVDFNLQGYGDDDGGVDIEAGECDTSKLIGGKRSSSAFSFRSWSADRSTIMSDEYFDEDEDCDGRAFSTGGSTGRGGFRSAFSSRGAGSCGGGGGGGGDMRRAKYRHPWEKKNRCCFAVMGAFAMSFVAAFTGAVFGAFGGGPSLAYGAEWGAGVGALIGALMAALNPGRLNRFVRKVKRYITVSENIGQVICGFHCRTESKAQFYKVTHAFAFCVGVSLFCYIYVFVEAFCSGSDCSFEDGFCSEKCWMTISAGGCVLVLNMVCTYVIYVDEPCAPHGCAARNFRRLHCSCDCDVMEYFKVCACPKTDPTAAPCFAQKYLHGSSFATNPCCLRELKSDSTLTSSRVVAVVSPATRQP